MFGGLSKRVDLKLVSRVEFASGALAMRMTQGKEPNFSMSLSSTKERGAPLTA